MNECEPRTQQGCGPVEQDPAAEASLNGWSRSLKFGFLSTEIVCWAKELYE